MNFIEGIVQIIDTLYPDSTIYVDEVRGEFATPSFHVELITSGMEEKLGYRKENPKSYVVRYYLDTDDENINLSLHAVGENLMENFDLLTIGTKKHRAIRKEYKIVDKILNFSFDIVTTLYNELPAQTKVGNIDVDSNYKEE